MNEENQQPQEPTQPAIEESKKIYRGRRGFLDMLPLEIRNEMDDYIRAKTPGAAWRYIKEKYSAQFPILAKITRKSFYTYAKKHNLKGTVGPELQALVTTVPPSVEAAIHAITDPNLSLEDKRAALLTIYKDIYETCQKLEATQINFLDAHIQQVILNNRKELRGLVKDMDTLADKQASEQDKNWLEEALNLQQVFISAVVNSYKITHTDQSLLSTFMDDFLNRVEGFMKNYRATKEYLKNELVKIS